jgi:hypothetical protein
MSTTRDQSDEQELDAALRRLDPAIPRSLATVDNLIDLTERAVSPRRFTRRIATSVGAGALAVSLIAAANGAGVLFHLGPMAPGESWSTLYIVYKPYPGVQCEIHPTFANLSDAQFQAIENKINDENWGDLAQDVEARESADAAQRGDYDGALMDVVLARLQTAVPTLSYGDGATPYSKQPGPRLVRLEEAC